MESNIKISIVRGRYCAEWNGLAAFGKTIVEAEVNLWDLHRRIKREQLSTTIKPIFINQSSKLILKLKYVKIVAFLLMTENYLLNIS